MKLVFSCLVLFSLNSNAKLIIITYEHGEASRASIVKSIFIKNYAIPSSLIRLKQKKSCITESRNYFELCVDKKKALNLVSANDMLLIRKSILSFSNQREVRNEF